MADEKKPYYIDMNIALEGLQGLQPGTTAPMLFLNVAINSIIEVGDKKGGLKLEEHARLKNLRTTFDNAIKTKEEHAAMIEFDDFKYLMRCWQEHTPKPQANEIVVRVWEKLKEAQGRHDRQEKPNG